RQIGMQLAHAGEFFCLSRRKTFFRIEAPDTFEQPLATQDLVAAGDAAMEIIRNVEERAVAVGDAGIKGKKIGGNRILAGFFAAAVEDLDRALGPDRPVAEKAALETHRYRLSVSHDGKRCHEIEDDVVVIASIKGDAIFSTCRNDAAHDVNGPI